MRKTNWPYRTQVFDFDRRVFVGDLIRSFALKNSNKYATAKSRCTFVLLHELEATLQDAGIDPTVLPEKNA
ncbi:MULTISPECIES: hypothetical protein [unclassified Bradyrhizobium]|uniref:hypothetical protein n=1 Tax=Bradyrhizobium sp. USDA 4541 TaxID=2817704 RepID=UPI0020A5794C|nr:hypothetical protein [Bradyrhizobium sp. USDA 4541]